MCISTRKQGEEIDEFVGFIGRGKKDKLGDVLISATPLFCMHGLLGRWRLVRD